MTYRVYADGREFGRDYTREQALALSALYASLFPRVRYYARRGA
jgi:hypothetical protein